MWEKAKVEMRLISDDLFLGPKDSITIWWKINPDHVRWFHVARSMDRAPSHGRYGSTGCAFRSTR